MNKDNIYVQINNLPPDYADFFKNLKLRINSSQLRASLSVNRELILLYWDIGKLILERQSSQGWGSKIIDRIASDLKNEFPDIKGFSPRNLKYMTTMAREYKDEAFVQQVVAQIPWGHNVRILDYIKDPVEREWYIRKTIENGWSRNVLVHQIESALYHRQGQAITNFEQTLPVPQSDLARQILKDPYVFDFLSLGEEASERELEKALINHIKEFLLELGSGFAFVGSQYHLEIGKKDYYIDLLFYHLKLRSYVVIDLKMTDFEPEFAGKMNFYLSAVDDLLRHPSDNKTIGIIMCKSRDKITVEYAVRDINKPVGISSYLLTKMLPEDLKTNLPAIEDLEAELKKR